MSDLHTVHHGKGDDGRAPEIEAYIKQSVDWAVANSDKCQTLVDIGCDYGFAIQHFKDVVGEDAKGFGCDMYYTHNPFGLDIVRESMEDPLLPLKLLPLLNKTEQTASCMWFMNHTLEHVYNPYIIMASIQQMKVDGDYLFIAVPHADSEWATWEGHYTIWNEKWVQHFAQFFGWDLVAQETKELREGHVEIWSIFK